MMRHHNSETVMLLEVFISCVRSKNFHRGIVSIWKTESKKGLEYFTVAGMMVQSAAEC